MAVVERAREAQIGRRRASRAGAPRSRSRCAGRENAAHEVQDEAQQRECEQAHEQRHEVALVAEDRIVDHDLDQDRHRELHTRQRERTRERSGQPARLLAPQAAEPTHGRPERKVGWIEGIGHAGRQTRRTASRPPRLRASVAERPPLVADEGRFYTCLVDAHALALLEFPLMRDRLADATAFAGGRALAEALVPSPDGAEVARRQALTSEAVRLLDTGAEPRLGGARDVREAAERAGRGGLLGPGALAEIADTVRAGLDARRALAAAAETAPLLHARADAISPSLGPLADRIERCIEADGAGLRDDASPRLRSLRRELRGARGRASDRVRELAASSALRDHLQEGFVTERNGRPVLAVRASSRGQVPGIVHDASGSGGTVFIEPFELVEQSNRIRELEADEREEVERILQELTALAGERAGDLAALVDALAAIDLVLACGMLSRAIGGTIVEVADEVRLIGARHPLLDPASAVPIDLDLGMLRAVIVSGPNTGGKTVALKTLGLCALLHQSGVRPPAQVARLPVFDRVLADIGDEQSIAQSLSTFSGHLRNVTEILHAATGRSLVLLDEVAAGTDPIEGSALAQALLARLAGRARLVMATTHYAELKEWASATDGVANAATAFDPRTHAPLYAVTLGRPGPRTRSRSQPGSGSIAR